MSHTERILVPISPGELVDKITILEIKCERIDNDLKRANVERELALLGEVRASQIELSDRLTRLMSELKTVNATLWQIEDDIRRCEQDRNFGPNFIELARSVYIHNDRRAELKRAINMSLGSDLVEEKSYADYSGAVQQSNLNSKSTVSMGNAAQLLEQGNVFFMNAQFVEAETCYRQAYALDNNHFEAANNLGVVLAEQGRNEGARDWYRRAIERNPRYYDAHFNLGNALGSLRDWNEACASYQRALEIQPGTPAALTNLALAHSWAGRVEQAARHYQLAIEAEPHHAGAHNGLGLMFQRLGRLEDAQQCFNHAVELDPQLPEPHVNRAQLWLLQQRLPEGFREFQWRWRLPGRTVSADIPQWNGESINGRRLLLWTERGAGDTIMLLRFAEEVQSLGAHVFAPLASIEDVKLIGLQTGTGKQQARDSNLPFPLVDWNDEIDQSNAFVDTAAILTQLDLVITCDTSLGHLAGALGVPVWIALSLANDWRWFSRRTDSPWYRTLRLYRQTRLDDWQPVFEQMARGTQQRISACAS